MRRTYELYEVGGAVRDSLLGIKSKDIDYTVVVTTFDESIDAIIAFNWFHAEIVKSGYEVFLCTPDMFTIRAKFPKSHANNGLVADFVLARKESGFIDGTRKPLKIELGTLEDDLRRRDFTVNAIARDAEGNLIDPFNGVAALNYGVLNCPVDPDTSFNDDPLRILRALRFSVTKDFEIHSELRRAIMRFDAKRFIETVSTERIREELDKMFRYDTRKSFNLMVQLKSMNPKLWEYILNVLWLKPTTEKA